MKEVSARLLQDFPGARYLFLTLTVKNCSGAELAQTIDKMNFDSSYWLTLARITPARKP